jgi:hypothetical protein
LPPRPWLTAPSYDREASTSPTTPRWFWTSISNRRFVRNGALPSKRPNTQRRERAAAPTTLSGTTWRSTSACTTASVWLLLTERKGAHFERRTPCPWLEGVLEMKRSVPVPHLSRFHELQISRMASLFCEEIEPSRCTLRSAHRLRQWSRT